MVYIDRLNDEKYEPVHDPVQNRNTLIDFCINILGFNEDAVVTILKWFPAPEEKMRGRIMNDYRDGDLFDTEDYCAEVTPDPLPYVCGECQHWSDGYCFHYDCRCGARCEDAEDCSHFCKW